MSNIHQDTVSNSLAAGQAIPGNLSSTSLNTADESRSNLARTPIANRWDLFCRIVDNYGDIGVCWRLSQQLAHEYHLHVRLFIDDFPAASKIIPQLELTQRQTINGVEICAWPKPGVSAEIKVADVVIETFGCALPDAYIQQMQSGKTIWINLEYLSAETWVSDFHAKPSPHPTLPLTKHFFFPGFRNDTGGLIREHNLITERDEFLNSKPMQDEFWGELALINKTIDTTENSIKISLFCYPLIQINQLFSALEKAEQKISLFMPLNSSAMSSFNDVLSDFKLTADAVLHQGNLTIYPLPFLSQTDYDRLLWACDLNFVRGEDSWVRAIWAGKPFVWQPYLQADDAHIDKLNAFLEVYTNGASAEVKSILDQAHLAWAKNPGTANKTRDTIPQAGPAQSALWQPLINHLAALQVHAAQQTNMLIAQTDLATKLVIFIENLRKSKV